MSFKITKPVKLIETFSGLGAFSLALRDLKVPYETWKTSDWDVNAVKSFKAIHFPNDNTDYSEGMSKEDLVKALVNLCISMDGKSPMAEKQITKKNEKWLREVYNSFKGSRNLGSITNIHAKDLEIGDEEHTSILTYSFPCFTGDTLVLTKDGYKEIKDVQVGDYVLTHDNTYQKVLESKLTGTKEIYTIKGMGTENISCTENHKFLVRKKYRIFPTYQNGKRGNIRKFADPEWIECKDLNKDYYLGIAINKENTLPNWDGICFKWGDNRKDRYKNEITPLLTEGSFWYVIGAYLGDGWKRSGGGIIIACNDLKLKKLIPHIEKCGFKYTTIKERTVYKVHICLKELELFCMQFGHGAKEKLIPGFMFDLPKNIIIDFLQGYINSDGYVNGNTIKISSISKKLIYGTAQLVAKAYERPYAIRLTKCKPTTIIEGRTVNQNDYYTITWKTTTDKQDKAFYENGYIWYPLHEINKQELPEQVYDLTVENAHSFTANGTIVHNCQDISVAGKTLGFDEDSNTRSSLLWQIRRILDECEELNCMPDICIMENVDAIHNKKNIANFQKWLNYLDSKNYISSWADCNSKDYGIAQSRKRCFVVSIRKDLTDEPYIFPETIPLTSRLKDYLEEEVDPKYYINNDKAKKLIQDLIDRGELPSEEVSTALLTNKGEKFYKYTDISQTICARDWKGFPNTAMAGVIEKNE